MVKIHLSHIDQAFEKGTLGTPIHGTVKIASTSAPFAHSTVGKHGIGRTDHFIITHGHDHGDMASMDLIHDGRTDLVGKVVQVHHVRLHPIQQQADFLSGFKRIEDIPGRSRLFLQAPVSIVLYVGHKEIIMEIGGSIRMIHAPKNHLMAVRPENAASREGADGIAAFGVKKFVDQKNFQINYHLSLSKHG